MPGPAGRLTWGPSLARPCPSVPNRVWCPRVRPVQPFVVIAMEPPFGPWFGDPKVAECYFSIMRVKFWENYILLALGAGFNANTPRVWHLFSNPSIVPDLSVCPCPI